ncbi:peptidoglycan editing factor PgeF [Marinitenerispora sediminis]|uniref:Purine nucleoside phosphorylase n=1 Tax=Marinitenerispora sediminis TaxID=1931232 RepID=A0A368T5S7_9ACTN|nr:peptidoglycan editing factor PgeF [Marinitenerispora sediminis]RCV54496.1 peptidoglycan editing factor PgeF [Marinitenerispora sediminis]RCV58736.1 peptidoglycan editing factor PgeF [Marinitenerispora sediminis]RCV61360.1 peptidoglycan editing factor PgeF [Marinitenerispora sediminis]
MTAVTEIGPGVRAGFTERYGGGVSAAPFDTLNLGAGVADDPAAVAENRRIAANRFGFDPERVVWMTQVHSADVAVADAPGDAGRVDAVVTTRPDLVLATLAADCLPILAADLEAGVIGAAHSGRLGTVRGVAAALIAEMVSQGASVERVSVLLGPAICGACYEVPPQMQDEVAAGTPEAASRTRAGTTGVDLRAGVTAQLRRAGVRRIAADGRCTLESPELFSHRRGAPTGRLAGFVWRA